MAYAASPQPALGGATATNSQAAALASGNAPAPANPVFNPSLYGSNNDTNTSDQDAAALAAANSAKTAADSASTTPTSTDQNSVIGQFQDQIDALNQVYASEKAQQATADTNNLGENTAIQARRGLLGSDFGAAATTSVQNSNSQTDAAIDAKHNTDLAAIYGNVNKAAQDAANARVTAAQKGADSSIQEIQGRQAAASTAITNAVKSYFAAGNDGSKLSSQDIQNWAQTLKTDPATVLNAVKAAKTENDAALAASTKADLDNKQTVANTELTNSNTTKNLADATKTMNDIKLAQSNGDPTVPITDINGNTANIPTDVAPYYNVSNSGVPYVDASALVGTAAEKTKIIQDATNSGYKVITNKNEAADLTNITDANGKLDSISTIMAGIDQPDVLSRTLNGIGLTYLATKTQSNPQQTAAGALQSVGLDILKAVSGIQGFRGNSTVISQITAHLPSIYDTAAVANQKVEYIRALINDRENALLGSRGSNSTGTNSTTPSTTKSGKSFDYNGAIKAGYTDAQIQTYINSN